VWRAHGIGPAQRDSEIRPDQADVGEMARRALKSIDHPLLVMRQCAGLRSSLSPIVRLQAAAERVRA
jgi:hypothetical protein